MFEHQSYGHEYRKVLQLPGVRLCLCAVITIPIAYSIHSTDDYIFVTMCAGAVCGFAAMLFNKPIFAFWIFAVLINAYIGTEARKNHLHIPDKHILPFQSGFTGEIESISKKDSTSFRMICQGIFDAQPLPAMSQTRVVVSVRGNINRCTQYLPGAVVRLYGKAKFPQSQQLPTDFDENNYCRSLEAQIMMNCYSENTYRISAADNWRKYIYDVSEHIVQKIDDIFPNHTEGLMAALLLGDKSRLSMETKTKYSLAGASHVLAVSGLHIGIIAIMVLIPLGFIRGKVLKLMLFIIAVTAFTVITGLQPSAIRAAIMSILIMISYTFQRKPQFLNIVCICGVGMCVFDPSLIFSIGFQLSFFAVLGIALFYQVVFQKLQSLVPQKLNSIFITVLIESISVSIAATVLVAPIVSYYFSTFSVIGIFVNMFAVPLTSLSMIFGFVAVLVSYITTAISDIYALSASTLLQISHEMTLRAAEWNFAAIQGKLALPVSIATSIIIIYLIFASTFRLFLFRLTASLIAVMCGFIVWIDSDDNQNTWYIIPRNDVVMTILPINPQTKLVLLEDRKPHQNPRNDYGLIDFLSKTHDTLIIAKRGNCSEWISVKVAEKRNVRIFPIQDSLYHRIGNIVGTKSRYAVIEKKQGTL